MIVDGNKLQYPFGTKYLTENDMRKEKTCQHPAGDIRKGERESDMHRRLKCIGWQCQRCAMFIENAEQRRKDRRKRKLKEVKEDNDGNN